MLVAADKVIYPKNFRNMLMSQFRKAKLRQPTEQRQSKITKPKIILIGPILFLYYEEYLVSSNLNLQTLT